MTTAFLLPGPCHGNRATSHLPVPVNSQKEEKTVTKHNRERRIDGYVIEQLLFPPAWGGFFITHNGYQLSQFATLYKDNAMAFDRPEQFTTRQRRLFHKAAMQMQFAPGYTTP